MVEVDPYVFISKQVEFTHLSGGLEVHAMHFLIRKGKDDPANLRREGAVRPIRSPWRPVDSFPGERALFNRDFSADQTLFSSFSHCKDCRVNVEEYCGSTLSSPQILFPHQERERLHYMVFPSFRIQLTVK